MKKRYVRELLIEILLICIGAGLFYLYYMKMITLNQILLFVAAFALTGIVIKLLMSYLKKRKYLNSALSDLDRLEGVDFEKYLMYFFRKKGYKVKLTDSTNDYGADLVLYKDGITTVVQAKRYKGKVGVAAVQEVTASKGYYNAERCMVVTNSYFTPNAIKLARANDVTLIDRSELLKLKKG